MRQRRLLILGGVLVAAGLLGMTTAPGGISGQTDGGPMMGPMMWMIGPSGQDQGTPAPPPIVGAETVKIHATELRFEPDRLVVTAGDPVNIRLTNDGVIFHDLSIPELGFHLSVQPGQGATGGLTVPTPGEYGFRCTVPGHANSGMVGTLVVEAPG